MVSLFRKLAGGHARRPRPTAPLCLERLEDRTAPALLGNQLFPADNPWNQVIAAAPVAANSAAVMNNLTGKVK